MTSATVKAYSIFSTGVVRLAMASTRRLAAILAADVAGYSRLMGADEEGTHERLRRHLRDLVDPKIKEHRGRIVKNTGDGMLAEFSSVVDAVRCAVEMQRAMADRNADTVEDKRITFRVGINLGDVIAEEDDIYGDGVNVAARLEALAEPGGICISRVVRDQIRDKLPYPFEDKGEQSVKNIARSVRVFALRPEAVAELPTTTGAAAATYRPCDNGNGRGDGLRHCRHRLVGLGDDEIPSIPPGSSRVSRSKHPICLICVAARGRTGYPTATDCLMGCGHCR